MTTTILILIGFVYTIGPKKLCISLFYIFSLHWFLVLIIKCRRGISIFESIEKPIKEIVENDEEIANALAESEEESLEQGDEIDAAQTKKKKADKLSMMEANQKKKAIKRLMTQYNNCLERDRIGNDDEKIAYEEGSKRMLSAMKVLRKAEQENFLTLYIRDFKIAFGLSFEKKNTQSAEAHHEEHAVELQSKNAHLFKGSGIKEQDFFMRKFQEYQNK
jgi:hypothetical protein